MSIISPRKATDDELLGFHNLDYIRYISEDDFDDHLDAGEILNKYGLGIDTPKFPGIFEFAQLSAGGTIACCSELNGGGSEICVNYMGGYHHARRSKASGFCVVNDIVLGIRELMKRHKRILYVDIDGHHGDGVECAFRDTNRVMTVSFHKYGPRKSGKKFFPETGNHDEVGGTNAKFYAVNVPLNTGMDDESYERIFNPIMDRVFDCFKPCAVVMQCGADSLGGDAVGLFNLTTRGHGKCVEYIKQRNLPLVILGGGGYNNGNVARLWTYETSIALGVQQTLPDEIPFHNYWMEYASDNFSMHTKKIEGFENENTKKYLDDVMHAVLQNLKNLEPVPSVQIEELAAAAMEVDVDETSRKVSRHRNKKARLSEREHKS